MISLLPSKKLAYYLYVKALVPYLVISKLYHLSVGEATLCEVMVIVYVIDKLIKTHGGWCPQEPVNQPCEFQKLLLSVPKAIKNNNSLKIVIEFGAANWAEPTWGGQHFFKARLSVMQLRIPACRPAESHGKIHNHCYQNSAS